MAANESQLRIFNMAYFFLKEKYFFVMIRRTMLKLLIISKVRVQYDQEKLWKQPWRTKSTLAEPISLSTTYLKTYDGFRVVLRCICLLRGAAGRVRARSEVPDLQRATVLSCLLAAREREVFVLIRTLEHEGWSCVECNRYPEFTCNVYGHVSYTQYCTQNRVLYLYCTLH